MTVNGAWANDDGKNQGSAPEINFEIEAVDTIKSIEILRNSKVIASMVVNGTTNQKGSYTDDENRHTSDKLYYYVRVIQENNHIGWSSPVWVS